MDEGDRRRHPVVTTRSGEPPLASTDRIEPTSSFTCSVDDDAPDAPVS